MLKFDSEKGAFTLDPHFTRRAEFFKQGVGTASALVVGSGGENESSFAKLGRKKAQGLEILAQSDPMGIRKCHKA